MKMKMRGNEEGHPQRLDWVGLGMETHCSLSPQGLPPRLLQGQRGGRWTPVWPTLTKRPASLVDPRVAPGSSGLVSSGPPRSCPYRSNYSLLAPTLFLQVLEVLAPCAPHRRPSQSLCACTLCPSVLDQALLHDEGGGSPEARALWGDDRRRRCSSWVRGGSARPSTMA